MARSQHLAVTGQQAAAFLGKHRVRRAVGIGSLVRLWRNAFAVPEWHRHAGTNGKPGGAAGRFSGAATNRSRTPRPATAPSASRNGAAASGTPVLTRLAAAELTLSEPITACLSTAAELYGFDIEEDHVTHVVGVRPTTLGALTVHRTPVVAPTQRSGRFSVVDPAETAVRMAARSTHPARGLAQLDAALRSGFVVPDRLSEMAACLHVDGISEVRRLVALADARAESPAESWLRWLCHDAALPRPVPQFWVRCADGAWYRLDLAWPTAKVALEYEGVEFHTGAALTRDRARLNALTAAGWTVLAVTAPMLTSGRTTLIHQITGELRKASAITGSAAPSGLDIAQSRT